MASLRGEASFEHEGSELKLVMNVEVLLRVEEATGLGLFEISSGLARLGVLAELLAGAIEQAGGKSLTRVEAGEILMVNPRARDAVIDALNGALPTPGKAASGNAPAARKSGTGKKR